MEISLPHEIEIATTESLTVADVVRSLQAQEVLIRNSVALLSSLQPQAEIKLEGIKLRFVSHDSPLREIFAATLFVAYQEDIERVVPDMIEMISGRDIPDDIETVVTVGVLLVLIYGLSAVADRIKRPSKAIENEARHITNVAGDLYQVSPDTLADKLTSLQETPLGKAGVRAAGELVQVAKNGQATAIRGKGVGEIGEEAIKEAASEAQIEAATESEKVVSFVNTAVDIRQLNRDSPKTGWWAFVPAVQEGRIRVEIYPDIDMDEVTRRLTFNADIDAIYELKDEGWSLLRCHLKRVYS